jgi:hypothetical protein
MTAAPAQPCKVRGCPKVAQRQGLCWTHRDVASSEPCTVDGCSKTARRAGLCWGHWKRRVRQNQPVTAPVRVIGKWEALVSAAEGYVELSGSEADWERARARLRVAVRRYYLENADGQFKALAQRVAERVHQALNAVVSTAINDTVEEWLAKAQRRQRR